METKLQSLLNRLETDRSTVEIAICNKEMTEEELEVVADLITVAQKDFNL